MDANNKEGIQRVLRVLNDVVGPTVHTGSPVEEALVATTVVMEQDDPFETALVLLTMVMSLMDTVTEIVPIDYTNKCDYFHYVMDMHEQSLAEFN